MVASNPQHKTVTFSTGAAWYRELMKRPALLGTRDLREVFGIGRTKAQEIVHALGGMGVGNRLKVDRVALLAFIIQNGRLP